ncbi:MAG: hypothetical protein ACOXZK_03345 [Bacteroidales bacterium]
MDVWEIVVAIIFAVIIGIITAKAKFFKFHKSDKNIALALWGLKLVATIIFFLIYTFYEPYKKGNDSIVYFRDGQKLNQIAYENPVSFLRIMSGLQNADEEEKLASLSYWNRSFKTVVPNDNRTIIRINALLHFISFGSYLAHLVLMSFFAFLGLMALYKSTILLFPNMQWWAILPIFAIPSTIFWSSGNIKEPILIFAMGFSILYFVKLITKFDYKELLGFTLFMLLLFFIKSYIFFLLLPLIFSYLLQQKIKFKRVWLTYFGVYFILILSGLTIGYLFPEYSFTYLIYDKNSCFIDMTQTFGAGSGFDIPELEDNIFSLIIHTPLALFNSLTRPFIWEADIWTKMLAALENIALITLLIVLIYKTNFKEMTKSSSFWFYIIFAISILVLSGLVTSNMGALVRYKSPALPFIFISFMAFMKKPKFDKKIYKLLLK